MISPTHYVGAFVLALLSGSAAAGVSLEYQEGGSLSFSSIFFFGPIAFLPVLAGGLAVDLPVHKFVLTRFRLFDPVSAVLAGVLSGAFSGFMIVVVLTNDVHLYRWGARLGTIAGIAASLTWWATILRPLKEEDNG